jgi:predicted RNA binding protein YcfA (HicA-like mRNA interferase family)
MPRMPQVTARDLIRFLKSQGFVEDRQSGSHLTLWHDTKRRSITIPVHTGADIGRGLAVRILKDAGFTVEDYIRSRRVRALELGTERPHADDLAPACSGPPCRAPSTVSRACVVRRAPAARGRGIRRFPGRGGRAGSSARRRRRGGAGPPRSSTRGSPRRSTSWRAAADMSPLRAGDGEGAAARSRRHAC